jgi:YVTN family beta-propeller protein
MNSAWLRAALAASALGLVAAAPAPHYAVVGKIAGPDGSWDYASVDAAEGRLYVARSASVTVVDLAKPDSARSIGAISHGHGAVPIADRGLLLVTSGQDDSVRLFEVAGGREVSRIAVGSDPDAAFYDAAGHRAVVMNAKAGTVSVIDVPSAKVTRTITLKPGLEFGVLGPNNTLFVNNEDANEIETANLKTGAVGPAIALTGCESPSGLAYDAHTGRLISACANGKAAIVDVRTRREVGLLDIDKGPDAVLLDATRRVAFIPCGKSGTLMVLSLASADINVVAKVPTEIGARTGAVDPRDGAVYLPTAHFEPAVAGARAVATPGSFHILKVGRAG